MIPLRSRRPTLGLLLLPALLGACATGDGPLTPEDQETLSAAFLDAHLAVGALRLSPFVPLSVPATGAFAEPALELAVGRGPDGAWLAWLRAPGSDGQRAEALLHLDRAGALTALPAPEPAPARIRAVDGVAGGLLLGCGDGPDRLWRWVDGALRETSAPVGVCAALDGGARLGPDHVDVGLVTARLDGETVELRHHPLDAPADPLERHPRPGSDSHLRWVARGADRGLSAWLADGRAGQLHRIGAGAATLDGPAARGQAVASAPDGTLWLQSPGAETFWRWHPETGLTSGGRPPGPETAEPEPADPVSFAWTGVPGLALAQRARPNPRTPGLTVPEAYWIWDAASAPDALRPAATTPCAERDLCRLYAETVLHAALPGPTGPLGIYTSWSWTARLALYLRPL